MDFDWSKQVVSKPISQQSGKPQDKAETLELGCGYLRVIGRLGCYNQGYR